MKNNSLFQIIRKLERAAHVAPATTPQSFRETTEAERREYIK